MSRFEELRDRYNEETRHWSMTRPEHPAYQELLEMGEVAVRGILKDFSEGNVYHLFTIIGRYAHEHYPGEQLVPEEDQGNVMKMAEHCVEWGRKKGLVEEKTDE